MITSSVRAAVAALVFVPAVGLAQVHRCDVGGRTVYQQAPCAGGGGAVVNTAPPSFGGSADDPVKEINRIEKERERRRDLADIDRDYKDSLDRGRQSHCNWLRGRADRFREHERAASRQSMRDWYAAERKAAEAQVDRECR